ncbi:MAG TPA: acyl-CoA mutase large subunit family protein [Alphaproteobacteria bacterium]|nr:acyl-CoA mutase large subunit family protein [Alphaproteobacteria bacterium]MDP6270184.1 acyl-CoA mutase large subunit family protein [Alphaproteobacteria bacterium]MDP7429540.1 acyl-CoA mutase large subunit family protein [Alphaproteobacteria bacterium]HJM50945.1 acyl-CoA mutase large subunit family protein [Alphaproteobacteria bacterium]
MGKENARERWQREYHSQAGDEPRQNRSGIEIKPLYGPDDRNAEAHEAALGYPGQLPMTRGIYSSMHRGRPWSRRQLVGLGLPEDYNARLKQMIDAGTSAASIIPCNSFMRGFDIDEVEPELVGTCGSTINTLEDLDIALRDIPLERISVALNDPLPFTLLAQMLALGESRGVPWTAITGTSNQSDYISHFVANHMFYRLSLAGSRRVLLDHIVYTNRNVPGWNPISVVGQHMQQAGATPAEAMAFTLSTARQYARDCVARGLEVDSFLPRFTFFFDISMSFFEEIAKFRAGRRIWARLAAEEFGAEDPRSWRFKFHAQTSGSDLTRQQPLNNIARVAVQAMAGIFGGLQSMHTDAYDEAHGTPAEEAARVAVATQAILGQEAHLEDVIDPLGGSYYVETLTDGMEAEISAIMNEIEAAGGMYAAVEQGLVQDRIGRSAVAFQQRLDKGQETIVGVTAYQHGAAESAAETGQDRPALDQIEYQIARLKRFRQNRDQGALRRAMDDLARAANDESMNIFEHTIAAARAGATHGEMVACLRRELGFGQPLVAA